MLIPIGLDQNSVRRWPWITIALILINFAVFFSTGMGAGDTQNVERCYREMLEYWRDHPYLELPRELQPDASHDVAKERHDSMVEVFRSTGTAPPESAEERAQEQAHFDQIVQRLRDALNSHPFRRWGLVPADTHPSAFITSLFIHGGWLHLLFNMLFLWLAGPFIEDAFGRPLFAILYLFSGVVAAGAHVLAFPASTVPLGGASGAVAGLMGAFLIRYATVNIRFFYWFFLVFRGTFDAPAWLMLPLWLLQQFFFASLDTGGRGGVAYWAHIGGFAFGAVVALGIKKLRVEEKFIAPAIEAQISISQHPALDEGMRLMAQGFFADARVELAKVLGPEPRNSDANLAMWHCLLHEGQGKAGAEYLTRVIEEELKRGDLLLAIEHWRELIVETGSGGSGALRWRLAAALEGSDREFAIEVLQHLGADTSTGVLAEKAIRRLEALGVRSFSAASAVEPARAPAEALPPPPQVVTPDRPVPPPPRFDSPAPVLTPSHRSDTPFLGSLFEVEEAGLIAVQEEGLMLHGGVGGQELMPFFVLRGVVVAGISSQPRPYLLLDLLLKEEPGQPAKVVRLLSTSFDPRRILNRPDMPPLVAFKELVAGIVRCSGAALWPPSLLGEGGKLTTFASLEAYELQVLTPLCET